MRPDPTTIWRLRLTVRSWPGGRMPRPKGRSRAGLAGVTAIAAGDFHNAVVRPTGFLPGVSGFRGVPPARLPDTRPAGVTIDGTFAGGVWSAPVRRWMSRLLIAPGFRLRASVPSYSTSPPSTRPHRRLDPPPNGNTAARDLGSEPAPRPDRRQSGRRLARAVGSGQPVQRCWQRAPHHRCARLVCPWSHLHRSPAGTPARHATECDHH